MPEKTGEVIEVIIEPDFSDNPEKTYANFMTASHDEFVFVLTFCDSQIERIRDKQLLAKDERGKYIIKAPVVAQVIVSPVLIPKLIQALKDNFETYQSKFAKPKTDAESKG